ncbi:Protein of unknown function [Escherichia coli D6-113.11]|nr:hypothetical protein HMPREF1592_02254 [Escherichia coli 907357]CDP68908.1 Protein of unknown function [Escherichia coli D6-113.11]CDU36099.1 Protein of unknown function [Escherichia coli D6-113.11]
MQLVITAIEMAVDLTPVFLKILINMVIQAQVKIPGVYKAQ